MISFVNEVDICLAIYVTDIDRIVNEVDICLAIYVTDIDRRAKFKTNFTNKIKV